MDSKGNIYTVPSFQDGPLLLTAYSPEGDRLWTRGYALDAILLAAHDNGLLMAGVFGGWLQTINLGTGPLVPQGGSELLLFNVVR